jgi:hypothetical protein
VPTPFKRSASFGPYHETIVRSIHRKSVFTSHSMFGATTGSMHHAARSVCGMSRQCCRCSSVAPKTLTVVRSCACMWAHVRLQACPQSALQRSASARDCLQSWLCAHAATSTNTCKQKHTADAYRGMNASFAVLLPRHICVALVSTRMGSHLKNAFERSDGMRVLLKGNDKARSN